jgi:phospholipid/cholesterol/gamma-HCH transport system substrate-binding protein
MSAEKLHQRNFEWKQVRVAALVTVSVLALAYGVYRVGRIFDVFAKRYEITTLVPDVLGLREGAPVTVAGQRVGQVKDITFIPVERKVGEEHMRVVLAISRRAQEQIRRDSKAFLRTQGLLGDKFVDIEPGTPGAAILQPGDTLAAGRSLDLDDFMLAAAGALDQATSVVGDLRDITGGLMRGEGTAGMLLRNEQLYVSMTRSTTELSRTLAEINRADGTFGRFIHDPALYNRIHSAVTRVDSLGAMILHGNGSLTMLLRSDSIYRSLLGTVTSADSAAASFADFARRMTQGQGTIQKMLTDPKLYDEFLKSVIDLQTLFNDIRQNPTKYKPNIQVRVFGGGGGG